MGRGPLSFIFLGRGRAEYEETSAWYALRCVGAGVEGGGGAGYKEAPQGITRELTCKSWRPLSIL